jgi:hypothetical protein
VDSRGYDVLLDTVLVGKGGDAINGLGQIGDPRALPVLWDLEAGRNPVERRYAITTIQRIMSDEI